MTNFGTSEPAPNPTPSNPAHEPSAADDEDRRKFLASCGTFATVTPPTITILLCTSLTSSAISASSALGSEGNGGQGNGSH